MTFSCASTCVVRETESLNLWATLPLAHNKPQRGFSAQRSGAVLQLLEGNVACLGGGKSAERTHRKSYA